MNIFTIGFTKTSAEFFFQRLRASGATKVIDVRLNNISQLSGFAKSKDLKYFLRELTGISYYHETRLAPTQDILDEFKKNGGEWRTYEREFMGLMSARKIEDSFSMSYFENSCLLCSEDKPHHCHRRLVCEYLNGKWGTGLRVTHL